MQLLVFQTSWQTKWETRHFHPVPHSLFKMQWEYLTHYVIIRFGPNYSVLIVPPVFSESRKVPREAKGQLAMTAKLLNGNYLFPKLFINTSFQKCGENPNGLKSNPFCCQSLETELFFSEHTNSKNSVVKGINNKRFLLEYTSLCTWSQDGFCIISAVWQHNWQWRSRPKVSFSQGINCYWWQGSHTHFQ